LTLHNSCISKTAANFFTMKEPQDKILSSDFSSVLTK